MRDGVGWNCRRYHAHALDAKIIQHELLMPWIIVCFHGYCPTECDPLSDSSGEIKMPQKIEKFPLQRVFFFFFTPPTYSMYLHRSVFVSAHQSHNTAIILINKKW